MKPKFTLQDYLDALDGAGPAITEYLLERAWREGSFDFQEYKRLVDKAYPDSW